MDTENNKTAPGGTIRSIQTIHGAFVETMGWRKNKQPLECVALICEEIGELTHELRVEHPNAELVGNEIADIILRAIDLGNEFDIDIDAAVDRKMRHNLNNIAAIKAKGRVK